MGNEINDADQGSLFETIVNVSPETDPALRTMEISFIPRPDGHYNESSNSEEVPRELTEEESATLKAVREAVARDNRSRAQKGRHSPLQRSGSYLDVVPGDVLPDFGVVTHTNLDDAKRQAAQLEVNRNK